MRTDLAFSHQHHAVRNVKITDCATCHALEPDGTLASPGANKQHMPCANSGCHQTEFTVRAPKICGVCHDAAVPWQKVAARAREPIDLEWSKSMSHAAHLARSPTGTTNPTCVSCHGDKLVGGPVPKPHAACAQCHNRGQRPAMTECAACHTQTVPAPTSSMSPMSTISAWSVAPNFAHTRHATDPRTRTPTACIECHTQIAAAKNLVAMPRPKMANCEGCHDGKTSFKTTGFECARCHAPKTPSTGTAMLAPRRTGWPVSGGGILVGRRGP